MCSRNLRAHSNTVSKRLKALPFLGSVHSSDVPVIFGGGDLTDYLIHFATNLDPNGGSSTPWPQYTTASRKLLTLYDAAVSNITIDNFRVAPMEFLTNLNLRFPL